MTPRIGCICSPTFSFNHTTTITTLSRKSYHFLSLTFSTPLLRYLTIPPAFLRSSFIIWFLEPPSRWPSFSHILGFFLSMPTYQLRLRLHLFPFVTLQVFALPTLLTSLFYPSVTTIFFFSSTFLVVGLPEGLLALVSYT
jgi:hypothetical protein